MGAIYYSIFTTYLMWAQFTSARFRARTFINVIILQILLRVYYCCYYYYYCFNYYNIFVNVIASFLPTRAPPMHRTRTNIIHHFISAHVYVCLLAAAHTCTRIIEVHGTRVNVRILYLASSVDACVGGWPTICSFVYFTTPSF
jgi:hypothetical protein